MLPEIGLAKGACTLWEDDLLLDYTIEVEDERFKVHKVVMASVSDYFKAMLTGGMVESREDKVRLEGLSSLAVKDVIEYIYTGKFGLSKASTEERLACAVYLQIPAAVKIYTETLCEEVDKENCFRVLSIFQAYSIKDGIDHTVSFMKHNIEDIVDSCTSDELTYDEFLNLMDCWGRSEWQLFTLAMHWLKKDPAQRRENTDKLMSRIHYCLMSPTELGLIISIKGMGIFADADGPWYDLVDKALRYHDLPTHQKVLEESEQAKIRAEPAPVCFGVHPSLKSHLYTIHEGKSWTHYGTVNPPKMSDDQDKCLSFNYLVINQFLIVSVNIGEHDVQWSLFDPRTLTWSAMASMGIPRDNCALVYHDKHLYALGGYDRRVEDSYTPTDVIEKYDFLTNTWSLIAIQLPVALLLVDAFSIGGCIYIPGGYLNESDFSPALYCSNPKVSEWSEKAPNIREGFTNTVCVEMNGEKFLANIDEDLDLHYYKPSVDKWLMFEGSVPSKLKTGNIGSLFATGNTIYLFDFDFDEDHQEAENENELFLVSEKWTLVENGMKIDSKIPKLTDHANSGWTRSYFTNICALLSVIAPTVRRGSAVLP